MREPTAQILPPRPTLSDARPIRNKSNGARSAVPPWRKIQPSVATVPQTLTLPNPTATCPKHRFLPSHASLRSHRVSEVAEPSAAGYRRSLPSRWRRGPVKSIISHFSALLPSSSAYFIPPAVGPTAVAARCIGRLGFLDDIRYALSPVRSRADVARGHPKLKSRRISSLAGRYSDERQPSVSLESNGRDGLREPGGPPWAQPIGYNFLAGGC